MKTWAMMYLLIWVAFLDLLIVFFPSFAYLTNLDLHFLVGVLVGVLAIYVFIRVRKGPCPERIKLITKTTAVLAVFDGALGVLLYLVASSVMAVPFHDIIVFLHFGTAVAIITQASSSATAYDMWEEKEFVQPSAAPSS
ncbi:MAG: hypothetical protein ABSG45_05400 [Nitrososphaerales archaeon]|jgi:heme A synthase